MRFFLDPHPQLRINYVNDPALFHANVNVESEKASKYISWGLKVPVEIWATLLNAEKIVATIGQNVLPFPIICAI